MTLHLAGTPNRQPRAEKTRHADCDALHVTSPATHAHDPAIYPRGRPRLHAAVDLRTPSEFWLCAAVCSVRAFPSGDSE
jgi:hypothetical protein